MLVTRVLLLSLLAVSARASEPSQEAVAPEGHNGTDRPDNEIVTLQLPRRGRLLVRGDEWPSGSQVFRWSSTAEHIELLPGKRDLSLIFDFDNSTYCSRREVMLMAGHAYVAGTKGRRRGLFGDSVRLWIEDTTTNEVVFGYKPEKQLRPGQVNPPPSFRWLAEHHWHDECMARQRDSAVTDKRRERREMIIALGEKWLASPLSKQSVLEMPNTLKSIVAHNERTEVDRCPRTPLPLDQLPTPNYLIVKKQLETECEWLRFELHKFVGLIEKRVRKGKIGEATARDWIDTTRSILSHAEEPE